MIFIIAMPPNNAHAGKKSKYNLILLNHKIKLWPGSKTNIAFVKPTSLLSDGIIAWHKKEPITGTIKISRKIKKGTEAPFFIEFKK